MSIIRLVLLSILSVFATGTARAQYITPDSGWYWNQGLAGSGYNIEFQDSTMYLSFFSYSASGASTFYTLTGIFNINTGRVSGDLLTFGSGQCIGCPYIFPQIINVGPASVQFLNKSNAIVTLPRSGGGNISTQVERFVFAYGNLQAEQKLGVWTTTIILSSSLPEGDVIRIRRTQTNPDLSVVAVGDIHPTNRAVIGSAVNINGTSYNYSYLIDFSSTSFAFYVAEFTLNGFEGEYFIYPKNGQPSGIGLPSYGTRIAGPNTANQVIGLQTVSNPLKRLDENRREAIAPDGSADHPQITEIRRVASEMEQLLLRVSNE